MFYIFVLFRCKLTIISLLFLWGSDFLQGLFHSEIVILIEIEISRKVKKL